MISPTPADAHKKDKIGTKAFTPFMSRARRAIALHESKMKRRTSSVPIVSSRPIGPALLALVLAGWALPRASVCHGASRRQSAEEWRRLTATNAPLPRVLVHNDEVRFYFPAEPRPIGFRAKLPHLRLPTEGYQVTSALLRLERKLASGPEGAPGWREPVVIAGQEWRRLATNLLTGLTPATAGHAKYYRGLLGDRLRYRDVRGIAVSVPLNQAPPGVIIDRRYSIEESLQILAQLAEPLLARSHPNQSLFLLMVHPSSWPQPLLIDTRRHRCVWLSPAALFEPREPAFPLEPTAEGISALIFESNGLALLKNPVSSILLL